MNTEFSTWHILLTFKTSLKKIINIKQILEIMLSFSKVNILDNNDEQNFIYVSLYNINSIFLPVYLYIFLNWKIFIRPCFT